MNTVELQGKISRIYNGRNVSIVQLYVRGEKKPNFPQIVFHKRDRAVLFDFNEGDFVNIQCVVKTRGVEEDGDRFYDQFIKGISIDKVKSEMSEKFGADLGGRFEYKNEVLIEGTITGISYRNGIANLLVNPTGEKFNIWMSNFTPNKEEYLKSHPIGSKIYAKCEVQTRVKKTAQNKNVHFQNIIIKHSEVAKA